MSLELRLILGMNNDGAVASQAVCKQPTTICKDAAISTLGLGDS
jgi:hypothetical protein